MQQAHAFVGRKDELRSVRECLLARRSCLLVGDAGIGKSALAAEGAPLLQASGWLVVSANCLPLADQLPLLPVVDVLQQLLSQDEGTFLEAIWGDCPPYVRVEIGRLVPHLAQVALSPPSEEWQRQRLFLAIVELWRAIDRRKPLVVIFEDVHWADHTTRDFLTYLLARAAADRLPVLLTARTPQADQGPDVTLWLHQLSRVPFLDRLQLGPLTVDEVAAMVAACGKTLAGDQIAELSRRVDGNPFFVEQLLAAGGGLGLPHHLAELLLSRAALLAPASRHLLQALAVAGRPLSDGELAAISGQPSASVRPALHHLVGVQLIRFLPDSGCVTRHALVGEAILGGLLAGERADLHGAVADVLAERSDVSLAAEVAGHLASAHRERDELSARVAAAKFAESVYGFVEATQHWTRAVNLAARVSPTDVAQFAHRGALTSIQCADYQRFAVLAECGSRAARSHGQRHLYATLAMLLAAWRSVTDGAGALPEMRRALEAFDGLPPSHEYVLALVGMYSIHAGLGQLRLGRPYLDRAVDMEANVRGSTVASIKLAHVQVRQGHVGLGLKTLTQARRWAGVDPDTSTLASLAAAEAEINTSLNRLDDVVQVGLLNLNQLKNRGAIGHANFAILLAHVVESLRALGGVSEAASLLDRIPSDEQMGIGGWLIEWCRSWIDLLSGQLNDAKARMDHLLTMPRHRSIEAESEVVYLRAELALWSNQAPAALALLQSNPRVIGNPEEGRRTGGLLILGMRACADMADRARVRRDNSGLHEARAAAEQLRRVHLELPTDPFADHAYRVTWAAEGAQWRAETERCLQGSTERTWQEAAQRWDTLGHPHSSAYALLRAAEAQLDQGARDEAARTLRQAHQESKQHAPLNSAITTLARLGRIDLDQATKQEQPTLAADETITPFGLTAREVEVLRLLTDGLTNVEIGRRLYMSPKTASVHVSAILRKLQATNRVQAAAIAQRLGVTN